MIALQLCDVVVGGSTFGYCIFIQLLFMIALQLCDVVVGGSTFGYCIFIQLLFAMKPTLASDSLPKVLVQFNRSSSCNINYIH